jgi:hypothetical protein
VPLILDDSCLSESGSLFLVPSFDPRTLCPQSSSCRSTPGEFPTSGTTRRLRPQTPHAQRKREGKFGLTLCPARGRCQVALYNRDRPGRPATAVPCALRDSRRAQGRRHWWRLGRIILLQRLRLRHHDMPLVAPNVHDHRRAPTAQRAHHGALPEQNLGIQQWKRAAGAERCLDARRRQFA